LQSDLRRQREELIRQLVVMGVNLDVAELAAKKVKYQSPEAALDYIFNKDERENVFNHDYVEGLGQVCYLCHEPKFPLHRQRRKSSHPISED
jgi:hypothetical protein